ncbi:response regulator transcription factor [Bacillus cereus]|uniref:Response regulator transcription factor n=1 Tax=Bacillus cereus TaxID=1396 RepID=A0AB73UC23_BACCE|nr:response regulator transcription factor [Bacillus cereus]QHV03711.1 DNA-binding response regulator [Bacillus cereus]QHV41727.1 response regulator transcription factor [Bacillus cereus]
MNTIMIVEDDIKIAELLRMHVEKYGYKAVVIEDFNNILYKFEMVKPDLVLLDINLPNFDGYYWCREIRAISTCPIIFLSARSGEMDQVMALENGGDDYITKPFYYEVVMSKIRSHLRRTYGEYAPKIKERVIEKHGLSLFPERMELRLENQTIELTKKETILFEMLLTKFPLVVKREAILEQLWDDSAYVDENTLSVNISRARKKLKDLGIEKALETVRGAGYRLHNTWKKDEHQS